MADPNPNANANLVPMNQGANFHYGAAPNQPAAFPIFLQAPPANHMYAGAPYNGAANPFYQHYPAFQRPTPKRGRPLGSKNKKKATPVEPEEEDEDEPPVSRRRSREDEGPPVPHYYDFEVKIGDEATACSHCNCNRAMFVMKPCNDYGLCGDCLNEHKNYLKEKNVPETCMFCKVKVVEYFRFHRKLANASNDD